VDHRGGIWDTRGGKMTRGGIGEESTAAEEEFRRKA